MDERTAQTKKAGIVGLAANAFLLCIKLLAGFAFQSYGMISDGLNSAGDVFSSAMTLIGNKISSWPSDDDHPYGHGKAEYIFSFIISISLLLVAAVSLKDAAKSLFKGSDFTFSFLLIATAVGTILTKVALFVYTNRMAKKYDSLLLRANALDHRNDILLTSGTLLGIIFGSFGVTWVDGVAGVLISLWIGYSGILVFKEAFDVLMDEGVKKDFAAHLEQDILSIEGVDHIDDVRTNPVGVRYLVIVKVSVVAGMTVQQSHSIAAQIKAGILKDHDSIAEVVVHINPVGDHAPL